MGDPAFFAPDGDALVPHADARGPWSPDMLHGRLLAGLAAWAIERDHGDPTFQPVRLTVDLFRSPAMEPVRVVTSLVRGGGRVRAADAVLSVGGVDVARASSLFLRRGERPPTEVWETPPWGAALPDGEPPAERPFESPFDYREVDGRGFGTVGGERRVWLRDRRPLVDGTPLTGFVRAAMCADFASPLSSSGPHGLDYINADLTLHLARDPEGEWIGVATDDRLATAGVSVAQCLLHDATGPVGWSSVCAVLNPTMPRPE